MSHRGIAWGIVVAVCLAGQARAGMITIGQQLDGSIADIVGTHIDYGSQPDLAAVNAVISAYNAAYEPDIATIVGEVARYEGTAFTPDAVFDPDDFIWYKVDLDDTVGQGLTIADVFAQPASTNPYLMVADPLNLNNDEKVVGFEYAGAVDFSYYHSKNGSDFTLWSYIAGAINPVYVETTPLDQLFDPGLGGRSGVGGGVSNIAFYEADPGFPGQEVPEPASIVLLGLGIAGLGGGRLIRRNAA